MILRPRQILAVLGVLVIMSGGFLYLEVSELTRAAWSESERDASYVAHALVWEIDLAARTPGRDPYEAVAESEDIARVLLTATQYAPTIIYAAFVDTTGRAVTHSAPDLVGSPLERHDPLPKLSGPVSLWRLWFPFSGSTQVYDLFIPLKRGADNFGEVRVGVSTAFMKSAVAPVLKRGIVVAGAQVLLGLLAAYLLSRIMFGPLRELGRGIQALKAGDFSYRVPRQAIDEFATLADALNELGEQFSGASQANHVMDHLGDGVVLLSPERDVTHINETAARQLGLEPENAVGRHANQLFDKDHPVRRLVNAIFSGDTQLSVRLEKSDGNALVVGHRILKGSDLAGVLVEIKDLNFLGELQSVVAHHTAMTRLGEMAAGVAHEIRNPLGAIHLNLETLRDPSSLPPEELAELLDTTRKQVTRLDRAVTGFLKVARLRELTLRPVDLGNLAESVVETLEPEATMDGMTIRTDFEEPLPRVDGDLEVLRQALVNLIKNAMQAKPSRTGEVVVRVRAESDKMVSVSIEDTGPGIPAEILPNVFDLYMTTKEGGTGVGLAFVRQAAEMHRGTVTVDTTPEGTAFHLKLRAASPVETAHA